MLEKIQNDLKQAMRDKRAPLVEVLRFVIAALKNKQIAVRPNTMSSAEAAAVVRKLAKQLKDAIEQYKKGGREDLAKKEEFQLSVIENYLPQGLSQEQVQALVDEVVKSTGATSMKQMGHVMKEVLNRCEGRADSKLVSTLVRQKLS